MKVPEPLFKVINFFVELLLKSPVHGFFSDSLMVIYFTGRKSGKPFRTPVRYQRDGDKVVCFTSKETKWWPNVSAKPDVELLVGGVRQRYKAEVITDDLQRISPALAENIRLFPQDAPYHNVRLNKDKSPVPEDFEKALPETVLVELTPA